MTYPTKPLRVNPDDNSIQFAPARLTIRAGPHDHPYLTHSYRTTILAEPSLLTTLTALCLFDKPVCAVPSHSTNQAKPYPVTIQLLPYLPHLADIPTRVLSLDISILLISSQVTIQPLPHLSLPSDNPALTSPSSTKRQAEPSQFRSMRQADPNPTLRQTESN